MLEQFLNDCRKTNTKVITPTNHNISKQWDEPIGIPSELVTFSKRGNIHSGKVRLALVLPLIGLKTGARFLSEWLSEAIAIALLLSSIWKLLY